MMTRDDAIHMMKEYARSVEPKVTITRQQFDAMRVALEVIAVGDSKTPSDTAAHGLVASGFWTDALETENSNSRAASTSANVAQGAEAYQYRDVAHWFREIAGARVLNHVLTEMTHSELALRAFSAGRALTAAQSASGDKS